MKTKMFAMFLALMILCVGAVSAVNLQIDSLEVNGRSLISSDSTSRTRDYMRGQTLELDICVSALAEVKDAQIYAYITGYDYVKYETSKVNDMTRTFDLKEGHDDCFTLNLEVPTKIDKDYFKLRIRADDRDGVSVDKTYQLYLKGIDRSSAIEIRDFSLDPEEVVAGRAFTGKVKVRNLYDKTIEDLKVTLSVPDLNIKVSEYMDEIDPDKSKTFEELLLRIPECAKAGTYDVEITVEFDNFEETQTMGEIKVVSSKTCGAEATDSEGMTSITMPNMQEVSQGTSVVYPIVIKNNGATSQTYALSVSGASTWSTTRIDPSAVIVVPAGQTKTAYLYVSANNNAELGDKVFTLNIESGSDSKSVPLVAKITKASGTASSDWSGFKRTLEVGLVILVVILIIVALVLAFNKARDNKKESEPYY
jgi:uncharacterized membrane protein